MWLVSHPNRTPCHRVAQTTASSLPVIQFPPTVDQSALKKKCTTIITYIACFTSSLFFVCLVVCLFVCLSSALPAPLNSSETSEHTSLANMSHYFVRTDIDMDMYNCWDTCIYVFVSLGWFLSIRKNTLWGLVKFAYSLHIMGTCTYTYNHILIIYKIIL